MNYDELLTSAASFTYLDVFGTEKLIELSSNELAFTIGQTPVVCAVGKKESILVLFNDRSSQSFASDTLPANISEEIFKRTWKVEKVIYYFKK